MSRRRGADLHEDDSESEGELNLVPYLDIITALVIFMVFTFQVVIEFRLIELLPPAAGTTTNTAASEDTITLTLLITKEGYSLATSRSDMGTETIPRLGDGTYDNRKLAERLFALKRDLGLKESLVMTASDDTEYRWVVAAMDTAREFEGQPLFPDVLLAKAVGVGEGAP